MDKSDFQSYLHQHLDQMPSSFQQSHCNHHGSHAHSSILLKYCDEKDRICHIKHLQSNTSFLQKHHEIFHLFRLIVSPSLQDPTELEMKLYLRFTKSGSFSLSPTFPSLNDFSNSTKPLLSQFPE